MVGVVAALVSASVVGKCNGRFEEGDEVFAPHNIPFIVLGIIFLWFGCVLGSIPAALLPSEARICVHGGADGT
eukprot:8940239-Prorocentrum_lima.AAC.1